MNCHHYYDTDGGRVEVVVTRSEAFRCHDVPGLERAEVAVDEGVMALGHFPEEITEPAQGYALAAMLLDAADALVRQKLRGVMP